MDDGYYHGIGKLKKPGFKVIKPPGGQTQINIFAQNHEVKASPINECQANRNQSSIFDDKPMRHCTSADRNSSSIVFGGPELPSSQVDNTPKKCDAPAPAAVTPAAAPQEAAPQPQSNGMHTPQGQNTTQNNANVRSSTKVMAPPGGRSSINLFG